MLYKVHCKRFMLYKLLSWKRSFAVILKVFIAKDEIRVNIVNFSTIFFFLCSFLDSFRNRLSSAFEKFNCRVWNFIMILLLVYFLISWLVISKVKFQANKTTTFCWFTIFCKLRKLYHANCFIFYFHLCINYLNILKRKSYRTSIHKGILSVGINDIPA